MEPEKQILELRDKVLENLKGKVSDFALGGGTALSLFYFRHRESYDLDFFTKNFSDRRIEEVIERLSNMLGQKIPLLSQNKAENRAKITMYQVPGGLKIDFIEDLFRHFDAKTVVNEVPILSKESIYLRKIYATCGIAEIRSDTGRTEFVGGRQEAKDYFDLYFLSSVFMPLSKFVESYCEQSEKERIIIWHSRYDRMRMKSGLLDIRANGVMDTKVMEKHFDVEIQKLIEKEMN